MPRDTVIKATIDIDAQISDFQAQMNKVKTELSKLSLTDGMKDDFKSLFTNLESEIKNIQSKTANKELNIVDEKSVAKSFERIGSLWQQLNNRISSSKVQGKLLDSDQKALDKLTRLTKQYNKELSSTESQLGKAARAVKTQADEVEKLERNLKKQIELQQVYTDRVNNNRAVEQIQQEIKETRELIKEKEKLAGKKIEIPTEEEFKAEWKEDHTTFRGWNAAYQKKKRDIEVQFLKETTQAQNELNEARRRGNELQIELNNTKADQKGLNDANKNIKTLSERVETAKENLKELNQNLNTVKSDAFEKVKQSLQEITDIPWEKFGIDPKSITSFELLEEAIDRIRIQGGQGATEAIEKINEVLVSSKGASDEAARGFDQASGSLHEMSESARQLDQMRNNILQFFSIGNAVNLFKRAIRSAVETVKDLDKVMTETAVVTEFSVGDMWNQLPEYTKRANELGVSIHDVYEASTLYYQQGLKTNEVMAVTNATLRMARIASLDAAEATDRITNALRGFNMEINESNADNIADVYSKLAAISASDVDEISTAMTKVASLASSANMQFENTAAFLAQIIETTRESAETAGTALKTVVARFSEVKDLYSKGELLGTDEEGEEVDVNKVSKALRVAGINLNEFLTGQKGLDEIFMDLASKWDDLDIVQQRYIATMAAGSRQQSRFIALMSDYKRTQELTAAAQDANGAAIEQYNKTLESLETKLTKLKNAWDEFLMSIANSTIIKGAVDTLTSLVQGINKIVNAISGGNGLLKSIAAIGISIGGLKLGRNLFNSIFGNPNGRGFLSGWVANLGKAFRGESTSIFKIGETTGKNFVQGFAESIKQEGGLGKGGLQKAFLNKLNSTFKNTVSAKDLGLEEVNLKDVNFKLNTGLQNNFLSSAFNNIDWNNIKDDTKKKIFDLSSQYQSGTISLQTLNKETEKLGVQLKVTGEQADQMGLKFRDVNSITNRFTVGMQAVGGACLLVSGIIEKFAGKVTPVSKGFKAAGIALMSFSAILPIVQRSIQLFAVNATTAISSIPIIGWAAAAISALIGVGVAIAEANENLQERAEAAEAALESATTAAEQAKDAYDNLSSSLDELNNQEVEIDKLTEGTKEWRDAVKEHNEAVMNLIGTYKELNVVSKNGVLSFTNGEEIERIYKERSEANQFNQIGAQIRSQEAYFNANPDYEMSDNRARIERNRLAEAINLGQIYDLESLHDYINKFSEEFTSVWAQQFVQADYQERHTQDNFERLKTYAQDYSNISKLQDNFYVAVGNSAISMANLNEEQQKYTDSLVNTTSIVSNLNNQYEAIGSGKDLKEAAANARMDREVLMELYTSYLEKIGVSAGAINPDGSYTDENGQPHVYREYAKGFEADLIKNELVPQYQKIVQTLTAFEKSEDDTKKLIAKTFEDSGQNLRYDDIKNLLGEIEYNKENIETIARGYYDKYGGDAKFGNRDLFTTNFVENILNAVGEYNKVNNEAFGKFTTGTIQNFNNNFREYIHDLNTFSENILNELEGYGVVDSDQQEKVARLLSAVDLSSAQDLKLTRTQLQSYGIEIAQNDWDNFINHIIERVGALNKIDMSQFKENVGDIKKTISELNAGEHSTIFDQEEYEKIKPYIDDNDFQETAYGVIYVGDDFDKLGNKIQEAIANGFNQTEEILKSKIDLGEVYEAAKIAGEQAQNAAYTKNSSLLGQATSAEEFNQLYEEFQREGELAYLQATLKSVLQQEGTNIKNLEIPGLSDLVNTNGSIKINEIEGLTKEEIENYITQIEEIILEKNEYEADRTNQEIDRKVEGGAEQLSMQWTGNETDIAALKKMVEDSNISKEIQNSLMKGVESFTGEQVRQLISTIKNLEGASKEGFDITQIQNFAEAIEEVKDVAIDGATQIAIENTRLNEGVKNIIESYENWSTLLSEDGPLGKGGRGPIVFNDSETQAHFETLKNNLQTTLNMTTELSDEFFRSSENMNALTQLVLGDAEDKNAALVELSRAAAIDMLNTFDIVGQDYEELVAWISSIDLEPLEVGARIDDTEFVEQLNRMSSMAEGAGAEIARALGFEQVQVQSGTYTYYDVGGYTPTQADFLDAAERARNGNYGNAPGGLVKRVVPTYRLEWRRSGGATGSSGGSGGGFGSSYQPLSTSNRNRTPASASTPKSSGSDSAKKEAEKVKQWMNPYDELYNLQQRINDTIREREQLELKFQDLLKDHSATQSDLVALNDKEVDKLRLQLSLQEQMLEGRKRQVANIANEIYEDSEGNRKTLAETGATQYANYDVTEGVIRIDWDAINQITDEELGKAVEQYISRLEELQGQVNETEDSIRDTSDLLNEMEIRGQQAKIGWMTSLDELYNLQSRVNQALREREQLEHRYEDMLKDSNAAAADLVENTLLEISALKQQLNLQERTLKNRRLQMTNIADEIFTDSNGNNFTFEQAGVLKYASYDAKNDIIEVDYDAINEIIDTNLGSAVETYITRLEELQGQIHDTEDTIEDINDQLIEIKDRGKEEYLNFEQTIYDALVNRREREIEVLESINSSLTDAASKTINAIRDEISKERQARENDKTEESIRDKEMRLAYLQRDTSGANDLEIQKLQEAIENDQQSYQDKIIDQTLQEMQDEATRAEQQRQAQIDLLKELLQWDQNYGKFWTDVEAHLMGAFDENGKIKVESDLYNLLKEDANFQALSKFKSFQWTEDMSKQIAQALQGLQNYTMAEAKQSTGSLTLGNGTTLKYDSKKNNWYDSTTKTTYTDEDLYWDYDKQAYMIRPKSNPAPVSKAQQIEKEKPLTTTPVEKKIEENKKVATNTNKTSNSNNNNNSNTNSNKTNTNNTTQKTVTYTVQKNDGPWQVAKGIYGSALAANQQWADIDTQLKKQLGANYVLYPGQVLTLVKKYAEGGLVDYTGPAWLDGTKSRPEMVLDAVDTQNFITLKNILAQVLSNAQNNNKQVSSGDNYFDIDIQAEIDSDYDVDQLADRIKKQIADDASYRNVNMISQMR